uniref:Paraneoplastic antigen Ma-like C-terminal domain-containing protein n=1 Tax=Poecilia formosa TaxID=48698 RepID=A0A096M0B2_POEFO
MLLDCEYSVVDSLWEVVQIDDYCSPKCENESFSQEVVPLARAIGNMTMSFQEQVHELALTYKMDPATISQVAASRICGKHDEKKLVSSTPASALKTQPVLTHSRPAVADDENHTSNHTQAANETVLISPLPAEVQKVIVEHIVKHDSPVHQPPPRELKLFSGNSPKPPSEVDFSIWRLRAKQVINDISLSEGQQRRMILDSLLTPALNVALFIGAQATPSAYLQELEKAYGNVTGGEELYIQFLETHQNSGEKASDYLRRLQTLLQEVVESSGVAKQNFDSQLLKQFLRGCWDDSLITALRLKESDYSPHTILTFSELLFKIRTYEKESHLKEMRRKRHMGASSTKVHTRTHFTSDAS